jgi:hypothetical protein
MKNNQRELNREIERERALYRYHIALERGDFAAVAGVLKQAEEDLLLERMILEVNDAYFAEEGSTIGADDAEVIRQLLQAHLQSALAGAEDMPIPPLTVGDVVARIQADAKLQPLAGQEAGEALRHLRGSEEALPDNLSRRNVRRLFERLGVALSEGFQKLFRDTAILLSMGREQHVARLAAARRQRRSATPESQGRKKEKK